MSAPEYSRAELLACAAAATLDDGRTVFVGTGLPMIAAMLAQRTHAPNLTILFEAGTIGPQISLLPVSVADSRAAHRAVALVSMHDVMSLGQNGFIDYGFLGAAQMDQHGNLNTTVIGDWSKPRARLPGSGGANDIGSLCWRTVVIIRQSRDRFVSRLDFTTTPGYLEGPGARERCGLPGDTGPYRVITQYGVFGFDNTAKQLGLVSRHPGVSLEEIREASEFGIDEPDDSTTTLEPTAEQLRILREIDPARRCLR
jgi:glutaconate CoA-transferase, subunit B